MKIGLFFGSFNPIHVGHLIIAEHVVEHANVEQVWLVVSPQNPLKESTGLLNAYHRLNLARLATEGNPKLKVSNIEFNLPKPSYTIDTLAFITEKYPQHEFSVIIGSDSYQNLPKWKNYQLILDNYALIVYIRPGFKAPLESLGNPTILNAPLLDISSTNIRDLIKMGKSVRYLLTDEVRLEIENQGYYRELKQPT